MGEIRGRFAPSPTGELHLGSAWTALLAWLQVRSAGGSMVLRVEDIDPERSKDAFREQMIADLKWLGLDWDEGPDCGGPYAPYRQHERRELYQAALERLRSMNLIYPCYCTRGELASLAPHGTDGERPYPGTCRRRNREDTARNPSLRLVAAAEEIEFVDGVYGHIHQNIAAEVGDFVVRRSDGVHAYQLAVVVDDAAMRITHVLRGADLLYSTPRQLLLYRLLGVTPPAFTHVPLLIAADGHRLSKRQRDLALAALRQQGVSAEAVTGYLAWKAGLIARCEPVKAAELAPYFRPDRIPSVPVIVDEAAVSRELMFY